MSYGSGRACFFAACDALGLTPDPPGHRESVDVLLRFIAYMSVARQLRAGTMSNYLAAVRHLWHRTLRFDPSAGSPLPHALVASLGALDTRSPLFRRAFPRSWLLTAFSLSDDPVVPLAFVLGFVFFLRVSEYTSTPTGHRDDSSDDESVASQTGPFAPVRTPRWLHTSDLAVHDGRVIIDIRRSKTDTARRGSRHARDATGGALCPVALLLRYLAERGTRDPDSPALAWRNGRAFTAADLNSLIKVAAAQHNSDPLLYSSHSLRAGGVTEMHAEMSRRGSVDLMVLVREGRWASVEGLLKYLRMDATVASSLSGGMLGDAPTCSSSAPPPNAVPPR